MKTVVFWLTIFTLLLRDQGRAVVLHRLREPATKSSSSSSSFSASSSSSSSSFAAASSVFYSAAARHKRRERWANTAFELLHGRNCSRRPFITSQEECEKVLRRPKSTFNLYVAEPIPHGKYRAFLPDRAIDKGRPHAGVLVLDPYPTASFGHLVLVFFIDQAIGQTHCQRNHGYISDRDCVTLAIRRRCRNELGPKSAHKDLVRRCEISFIPTILRSVSHERRSNANSKEARLYCYTDIPGFASSCPRFLPDKETSGLTCDPLKINTKRCDLPTTITTTSFGMAHGQRRRHLTTSRCRPMEICDWAVLLSGGWNRFTLKMEHKTNLRHIYNMLRRNGFHSRNIEVFYANGSPDLIPEKTEKGHIVYPSVMKLALRNYIRNLCTKAKCVDSLVFYMNSPTKADGTALLWDINGNGMAEDNERYKLGELKKDLKHCSAESVFLIVDQSHAGHIAGAFHGSEDHPNVQVLASCQAAEYSYGRNFTEFIASYNHTHTCLPQVLQESKTTLTKSTPVFAEGKVTGTAEQRNPQNIFGAPCNLTLPFRSWELDSYRGCRNVPTAVWLKILRESSHFLEN